MLTSSSLLFNSVVHQFLVLCATPLAITHIQYLLHSVLLSQSHCGSQISGHPQKSPSLNQWQHTSNTIEMPQKYTEMHRNRSITSVKLDIHSTTVHSRNTTTTGLKVQDLLINTPGTHFPACTPIPIPLTYWTMLGFHITKPSCT